MNLTAPQIEALKKLGLSLPGVWKGAKISEKSTFEPPSFFNPTSVIAGSRVDVGAFCSIVGGHHGTVSYGRYCSVARDVAIGLHEHPTTYLTSSRLCHVDGMYNWKEKIEAQRGVPIKFKAAPFHGSSRPTRIGNDVWIGYGAYIKTGITVGDGAIIAARAVVVKDVPPYTIVAGTPARPLRMRFPKELVERLLAARWWDYCLFDIPTPSLADVPATLDALEKAVKRGEIEKYAPGPYTAIDLINLA